MSTQIRLLIVDDSLEDMQLILEELVKSDYEITCRQIKTQNEFNTEVKGKQWDVILSEFNLPEYDLTKALETLKYSGLDLPLIIVSKKISEIKAVDAMKNGCKDYVYKNCLLKLPVVIKRELNDARVRLSNRQMSLKLEKEKEQLAVTLESIGDGVITSDIKGNIIMINKAAEELTGWSQQDAIGKSLEDVFRIKDKIKNEFVENPYSKVIRVGITMGLKTQSVLVAKDGVERYVSASNAPIKNSRGSIIGVVVVFRDITKLKQFEEEMKMSKEAAEDSNKAKSEFLANMSHEISTPLNGIIGMTNLTIGTDLTIEQKENLNIVQMCANTLLKVINNILDFSKIEAGKMTIEAIEFEIKEIIDRTVKSHMFAAKEKGLELVYEIAPEIPKYLIGDPVKIHQILNNLIGNAMKFTENGQISITVEIDTATNKNLKLKFSVKDTGIGLTEEDMKQLFKSFSQVDGSITRKYGGTGLGLVISKQLIEMLGGEVWVESKKGVGSTFIFTINYNLLHNIINNEKTNIIEAGLSVNKSLDILIVEDDKVNQTVTNLMLSKKGHKVEVADNGKKALEVLKNKIFDIILMDIQMPEMDGIEATKQIRKNERGTGKHIPIIALTACAVQGDRERFIESGMDEYIAKPVQIDELLKKIIYLVNNAEGMMSFDINTIINENNNAEVLRLTNDEENTKDTIIKLMNTMKNAINSKLIIVIEKTAHLIKESQYADGNLLIRNLAFKIELAARKGHLESIEKLYNDFEQIVKATPKKI
jgi:PAS domain S-box-containing protein